MATVGRPFGAPAASLVDLVKEFEWTRPRHGGNLNLAAPIFGYTPAALEQVLQRARRAGIEVNYTRDR